MPKKKLQKYPPAVVQQWITYMDYLATGEGRTLEINFCYADTAKEAIEKHLDRFYGQDSGARNYFGVGVEASPLESARAKEVISAIFKKPQGVIKILRDAGGEFFWRFHFNYS
jgi:hypothetical protein